jgi:hypothetical protein
VKPSSLARVLASVALVLVPFGCPVYVDFYDPGQAAGTTTTGAVSGTGGAAGSGTSGTGGAGAGCAPGEVVACYDGPAGTEGHGLCQAGSKTCDADGKAYGPCLGEVMPTPEDCATPTDEDCDGLAPACKGNLIWSERFGDASNQTGVSVATDSMGNVVVIGSFTGTINLGGGALVSAGGVDLFVAKLDGNGNHLWSERFGDAADQHGQAIAIDGMGNVFITGDFAGSVDFGDGVLKSVGGVDLFIAKLDADGNHKWSKRFGDAADQTAGGIAADSVGNVFATGQFTGAIDFGDGLLTSAGGLDLFVAKLDANGNHLWSERFGSAYAYEYSNGLAIDGGDDVLLTGSFGGVIDFGDGPLTSAGGADLFVAKLDASGNHKWSKRFGDGDGQAGKSLSVDGLGNVVLTGSFYGVIDFGGDALPSAGGADIFVAKLDARGNHVWSQSFGDPADQIGESIAVTSAGSVFLTGNYGGQVDFGCGSLPALGIKDIFLVKFDPKGICLWSKRFGDAAAQNSQGLAVDGAGDVFVTGSFSGSVNFGGGALQSTGGSDAFLAKFAP